MSTIQSMHIPENLAQFIALGAPGSMSYPAYRQYVKALLTAGKSTGSEQRDDYLEYTKLNEVRMDRWEKHVKIACQVEERVKELEAQIWLVITEGWCGDGAQTIPVFFKIAELNPKIRMLIVLRDDNPGIMNEFLTGTSRSIPIVVAISNEEILWKWGPRPRAATALIPQWKSEASDGKSWKEKLHLWYARDQASSLQHDLIELLN